MLGWPQKCVQTLGSERGGPALGLAGLSENKDGEDFETEGADPSLPVSLWIGEGFLIPTQRLCVLPHPPSTEEEKRSQGRGEDFETCTHFIQTGLYNVETKKAQGFVSGAGGPCVVMPSSPFRVLFQGLPSGPCWYHHLPVLSYFPLSPAQFGDYQLLPQENCRQLLPTSRDARR